MKENEEKNVLMALYGSKAFVKIKQCLDIDKMCFSFVDKADPKKHIDCYMSAEEFGAVLMAGVKDRSLLSAIIKEKAKGEQYPKAVWSSPVGGNAKGNNGKPVSRYFTIGPSSQGEVLFTATVFPAEANSTGAFIKVKGSQALLTLRIPATFNDLRILQYKWSFLEADYMGRKYTVANMKSEYRPHENTETSAPIPTEEQIREDDAEQMQMEDEEVPFVGTSATPVQSTTPAKATGGSSIQRQLIAVTALAQIKGKNAKVCEVTEGGVKKRLICLTDKITDRKLPEFEKALNSRVANKGTLEFKANVFEKGDDLYLVNFA